MPKRPRGDLPPGHPGGRRRACCRPDPREGLHKALPDQFPHVLRAAEAHLQLGRMDVDVDRLRRHLQEDGTGGVLAGLEEIAVGVHDGLRQEGVPHVAAVDVEEQAPRRGAREVRSRDKPPEAHPRCAGFDRDQVIAQVASEQQDDPVAQGFRPRDLEQRPLPGRDPRPHPPVRQQHADDDVEAVTLLRGVLPQKLPAHGKRAEDPAHGDRRALGAADGLVFQNGSVLHDDARALHVVAPPGGHLHAGDRRDARQRLAPEPEGPNAVEIGNGEDLARGVPFEGDGNLLRRDAGAVVGDPDRLLAAAPQIDGDVRGARVDGVLQQLLHDGRGPLDDLAGGDLRGNLMGENGNSLSQSAIHNFFHP